MKDKVIVLQTPPDEKTDGGLYIPELSQEAPKHGTVVAVGTGMSEYGKAKAPMQVKVGDRVYFGKHAVIEIQHDGKEHLIMKENNILLIEN